MTHFSEERTYQPVRLPYPRIEKLDEDAVIYLNRNFSEIERQLTRLQVYENNTGTPINDTFYFDPETGDVSFAGNLRAATGTFAGLLEGGSINIGNGNFIVDVNGYVYAAKGNFKIDPDGDGVVNNYAGAARWKLDNSNYIYQSTQAVQLFFEGNSKLSLRSDGQVVGLRLENRVSDPSNPEVGRMWIIV